MTKWFVTDMDRENITTHKSYKDARREAVGRIGSMTPERRTAGFYNCEAMEGDIIRSCYIIKEGTKNTGFEDIWE